MAASAKETRVVIVGGGFAGAQLAHRLEMSKAPLHITLVDRKEYFENNLATPRAYVKGRDFGKTIIDPHTAYLKQASIVVASCTKVSDDSLTLDNGDTLPFDYLALCSGSNYSLFKTSGESKTIEQRLAQFDAESESTFEITATAIRIKEAKGIIVVGGGPAGVELVGEIAELYPNKPITLITSSDRLLPSLSEKTSKKMAELVKTLTPNVKVIYNDKLSEEKSADGRCVTEKGTELDGDCVLMAVGTTPATGFIDSSWLDDRGFVKVEPDLRVVGKNNIFCAGDLTNIKEEKLAYRAEAHAAVIAQNIVSLTKDPKAPLKGYSISWPILILSYGSKNGLGEVPFLGTIIRVLPTYKAKTLFVPKIKAGLGLPSNSP